jgi:Uma2 family endonuclease
LTAADVLDRPEFRYGDLVAGSFRISEPPGGVHGRLATRIAGLLETFVARDRLGTVLVESGFLLAEDPDTVRGPDVSFVARERLESGRIPAGFIQGAPNLAVEIKSPSDTQAEMLRKVADYLEAGAEAVWVVDPSTETVAVHRSSHPPRTCSGRDRLAGDGALLGFACPVRNVFRR